MAEFTYKNRMTAVALENSEKAEIAFYDCESKDPQKKYYKDADGNLTTTVKVFFVCGTKVGQCSKALAEALRDGEKPRIDYCTAVSPEGQEFNCLMKGKQAAGYEFTR